jgi:radical SAM superfamily enzyme YgiQ (UPF0313 family)
MGAGTISRGARKLRLVLAGMMDDIGGPNTPQRSNMLGLALLKSFCDSRPELSGAPHIIIFDESTAIRPDALTRKILRCNPDAVGFSLRECNYRISAKTATLLRKAKPGLKIIIGGYEAGARTGEMLRMFDADCAVIGEGEAALAEILLAWKQGSPIAGIPGTACMRDGKILHGPARKPMNLEEGVSPYTAGLYASANLPYACMTLETSRGCPNNCAWCSWPHNSKIRVIPLERLRKEIEFICTLPEKYGVAFSDSNIFASPERAVSILGAIHSHDPAQKRQWWINPYLGHITPNIARLCNHRYFEIACGVETVNPKALEINHRFYDRTAETSGAMLLAKYAPEALVSAQIICGLPGDTLAGFCNTIDRVFRMGFRYMDVFPLNVLPGTYLHRNAEKLGIKFMPESPFRIIETPDFPLRDMKRAHCVAHTVETLLRDDRYRESLLSHALAGGSITIAAIALAKELAQDGFRIESMLNPQTTDNQQLATLSNMMRPDRKLPASAGKAILNWKNNLLRGPKPQSEILHNLRPSLSGMREENELSYHD